MPLFTELVRCLNSRSVDDLLKDPEQQDGVFAANAHDSILLTKREDKMLSDGETHMKESHPKMRSCMAMMDDMRMRCQEDWTICTMMCDKMMNSGNTRSIMQDRMKGMNMVGRE